ncbi:MAG: hypothetical protein H6825_09495 [Planctomycetes bacterium]|nr:hypothetical protein [Planctomycetota bacterium]
MSPLARAVLVVLTVVSSSFAQQGRNPSAWDLGEGHLALSGWDPVAYFDEGGGVPTRGTSEHVLEHEGVTYRFASDEHAQVFAKDPARFEPAYGGWCAYAMSQGKKVEVDPRAFRIGEGRLLLFSSDDYVQVDGRWAKDEHALLGKADVQWKKLSGEEARKPDPSTWRPVREFNLTGDSLAIEGYDPVSYFPEGGGTPTKGKESLAATHLGVKYLFANEKDRKLFLSDPEHYEPQHGGWCSYAMGAKDEKVEVDPKAFRLTSGQLHLFYDGWLGDTRDDWDEDVTTLKPKADTNWKKLLEAAEAKLQTKP